MLRDYLQLHFIVLLWGFTAILGLLISIPSVELVFYRTLLAALGLFVLLSFKKESIRLDARVVLKLVLCGQVVGWHWILFFLSARVSNASVCLAGMATCALWTSLLEPLVNRKGIKWYEVMLGLIIIAGLYIIFHFEFNHFSGLMLAIASAFLASVFTVINGRFTQKYNHYTITFYEMIGACLCTIIFMPFYQYFFAEGALQLLPSVPDWLYIGILAIVCTVYAYSIAVELMKRLTPFAINLTVNLEPVYGIVLAALFFNEHEKMTRGFYWGTLVILLAVLSYPALKRFDQHLGFKSARDNG
jgi:drug/metabolite transporter (DMT)-like permease